MIATILFWGCVAAIGLSALCFVVKRRRPSEPSYWRDCDLGDFPSISELFHVEGDRL